jgi:hypothetical protein
LSQNGDFVSSSGKIRCISAARKEKPAIDAACPPTRHPQGEAIHTGTPDCFTLRVRNDGRDNLNGAQ